ncbi:hypothetical protein [Bythopirellula polymerisocia]|uniref:Uncharacterized protein n=1 Tax=Bythopirellula polymerisocia TaxID=2528003 RepID=A0A5C6CDF8_9BACT|nr:hypothetical protein [Bythopirellula polymerisocia]TWU21406.1 hypothetical protein Pla144_46270 [Bythopirellula polymerisocia]
MDTGNYSSSNSRWHGNALASCLQVRYTDQNRLQQNTSFDPKRRSSFLSLQSTYQMGESYEKAVAQKVEAVTAEDLAAYFAETATQNEEHEKALNNPETLQEFHTFLR